MSMIVERRSGIPLETQSYATSANDGAYRAAIQVTIVAHQRYIDKSWRF